jgi:hypothetical protein
MRRRLVFVIAKGRLMIFDISLLWHRQRPNLTVRLASYERNANDGCALARERDEDYADNPRGRHHYEPICSVPAATRPAPLDELPRYTVYTPGAISQALELTSQ